MEDEKRNTDVQETPKKVKKKKPFFKRTGGIVLIVVLVIIIGGGLTCFALRHTIMKAVLGPVNYYFLQEGINAYSAYEGDFSVNGDLTLGKDYASIKVFTGADTADISVDIDKSGSAGKSKVDVDFFDIFNIDLQRDGSYVSSSINGSDPAVLSLKDDKKKGQSSPGSKKKKQSKLKSMSKWELIKWGYNFSNQCLATPIEEGNIKESVKEYRGIECDVTTFIINGQLYGKILDNLADNLEEDETTNEIFKDFYSSISKITSGEKYDVESTVKSLRNLADRCKEDKSKGFTYSVYYDDGKILNREIGDVSFGTYEENGKNYLSINIPKSLNGVLEVKDTADVSDVHIDKSKAVSKSEFTKNSALDMFSGMFKNIFGIEDEDKGESSDENTNEITDDDTGENDKSKGDGETDLGGDFLVT